MDNQVENQFNEDEKVHMQHKEESLDVLESRRYALYARLEILLSGEAKISKDAIKSEKERIEKEISYISKTIKSKKAAA